jgi:hypothetical protein
MNRSQQKLKIEIYQESGGGILDKKQTGGHDAVSEIVQFHLFEIFYYILQ